MRVPFPEPTHLFIDGQVAIYLSSGSRKEIMASMDRLQKIVHLAATLMGEPHVGNEGESHVGIRSVPESAAGFCGNPFGMAP